MVVLLKYDIHSYFLYETCLTTEISKFLEKWPFEFSKSFLKVS